MDNSLDVLMSSTLVAKRFPLRIVEGNPPDGDRNLDARAGAIGRSILGK